MNWLLLLPPVVVLATAWIGRALTAKGMTWYATIKIPSWTPKGSLIGVIWTVIFLLSIAAWVRYFSLALDPQMIWLAALLLLLSCVLNATWSWLFFVRHRMSLACWDAAALCLSVLAMMVVYWKVSHISAYLLIPYAAWTAYAGCLNWHIVKMNR